MEWAKKFSNFNHGFIDNLSGSHDTLNMTRYTFDSTFLQHFNCSFDFIIKF